MSLNKPIVGTNARARGGIHCTAFWQTAARRDHDAGIHRHSSNQIVLGKHLKARFRGEAQWVSRSQEETERAFTEFKELRQEKDITDRDIESSYGTSRRPAQRRLPLKGFSVHTGSNEAATAVITLEKDGVVTEDVALGNGPVDAAWAVDKIVNPPGFQFENYVIQSVSEGKDSLGRLSPHCGITERRSRARASRPTS